MWTPCVAAATGGDAHRRVGRGARRGAGPGARRPPVDGERRGRLRGSRHRRRARLHAERLPRRPDRARARSGQARRGREARRHGPRRCPSVAARGPRPPAPRPGRLSPPPPPPRPAGGGGAGGAGGGGGWRRSSRISPPSSPSVGAPRGVAPWRSAAAAPTAKKWRSHRRMRPRSWCARSAGGAGGGGSGGSVGRDEGSGPDDAAGGGGHRRCGRRRYGGRARGAVLAGRSSGGIRGGVPRPLPALLPRHRGGRSAALRGKRPRRRGAVPDPWRRAPGGRLRRSGAPLVPRGPLGRPARLEDRVHRPPPRYHPLVPTSTTRRRSDGPASRAPRGRSNGRRGPAWPANVPAPVLVEQRRGAITESRHRGHVVQVGADGAIERAIGDPNVVVTLRSAVKPFALAALVESGAADELNLTQPELAVMASSHHGEDLHVRTLQAVFRRAALSQNLLACGTALAPLH